MQDEKILIFIKNKRRKIIGINIPGISRLGSLLGHQDVLYFPAGIMNSGCPALHLTD
jgi:hypothetical protein